MEGQDFMKSADEQEHDKQQAEKQLEPGQKAVDYIQEGVEIILRSLGVDTNPPADIKQQQLNLGIHVLDTDEIQKMLETMRLAGSKEWEKWAWLTGFFLRHDGFFIQVDTGATDPTTGLEILLPIAFVGDAGIKDGRVVVQIHDFRSNKVYEVRGIRMPEGRQG